MADEYDNARAILLREEGLRLKVYDDATGRDLIPGMRLVGHPTIGIGRCLDRKGITLAEAELLLKNDMEAVIARLSVLPLWQGLDGTRRAVLICMAYQMGVEGLLAFKHTLGRIEARDYAGAAKGMLDSDWAKNDTPERAQRMAALMAKG